MLEKIKNKIRNKKHLGLLILLSSAIISFNACGSGAGIGDYAEDFAGIKNDSNAQVSVVEQKENAVESKDSAVEQKVNTVESKENTVEQKAITVESKNSATEQKVNTVESNDSNSSSNDSAKAELNEEMEKESANNSSKSGKGNSDFGHKQGDSETRTKGSQNNSYGKSHK